MRSPWSFWLSAWCTFFVLAVYAAADVQTLLVETPWLSERAWVLAASDRLLTVSRVLGLARIRDGVEALHGDDIDPEVALAVSAPASAPAPAVVPAVPPASTGAAPSASAAVLAEPPASAHRVLLLGASSMQFALGVELERLLAQRPDVIVERHGKASTGLARRDIIDWPVRAAVWIEKLKPDLVITNFGGNDAQAMTRPGKTAHSHVVLPFASEAWDAAYAEQVDRLVDAAFRAGSRIVMLGMPVMRQASYSTRIAHVNAVTRAAVEARGGLYLSTWEIASDENRAYKKSLTWNGKTGPMRAPDGHHYTTFGGRYVADQIARELERRGLLPPAPRTTTR